MRWVRIKELCKAVRAGDHAEHWAQGRGRSRNSEASALVLSCRRAQTKAAAHDGRGSLAHAPCDRHCRALLDDLIARGSTARTLPRCAMPAASAWITCSRRRRAIEALSRANSARISAVCWPRSGAGAWIAPGVPESWGRHDAMSALRVPGRSTLRTSAPKSARMWVSMLPATRRDRSSTRTPCIGPVGRQHSFQPPKAAARWANARPMRPMPTDEPALARRVGGYLG